MDGCVDIKKIKLDVKEDLVELLEELKENPLDAYSFEDVPPKKGRRLNLKSFSFYEDCLPPDSLDKEPEFVVDCPICQFKCNGYAAFKTHVSEFVGTTNVR